MKNQLLFAVLAVLAIFANGSVVEPKENAPEIVVTEVQDAGEAGDERSTAERNLSIGWIAAGDRLLYRNYFYKYPMYNAIQSQDVTFRGTAGTRLTAIRAQEVGATQFATARLVGGGLGSNVATIRLSTARSYGYNFVLEFWGR